jgi:KaiC/GvpD/RAD55 family RecA-like ATPase
MWIFTETGFVSAVRHYSEKDKLVVRARDEKSLESLANYVGLEIVSTPSNDYPYRVLVADAVFATWLSKQTMAVDYTNFKNRVHETRGHDFSGALMGVWETMHQVEDEGAR